MGVTTGAVVTGAVLRGGAVASRGAVGGGGNVAWGDAPDDDPHPDMASGSRVMAAYMSRLPAMLVAGMLKKGGYYEQCRRCQERFLQGRGSHNSSTGEIR